MLKEYVYKVFDTQTKEYWKGPRGKSTWGRTCDAKNSWNAQHCYRPRRYTVKFNEQDRFEVHQFLMTLERVVPR